MGKRLYVGNLSYSVTEADLDDLLNRLRGRGDTPLVRMDFPRDSDLHRRAAYTDGGLSSSGDTLDRARLPANLRSELSRFHAVSFVPEVWSQRTCPTRTR